MLVARVPQEPFLALAVDDEDLPRNSGGGIGSGALGVGKQRPDMFCRQLGKRSRRTGAAVNGEDATPRGRASQQGRVGSGGERRDPGCVDFCQLLRLAGADAHGHGVDPPLVTGAKVGRAAVGGQCHAPGKGCVERQARRLHARNHFAVGQHHAGRGLALLEILGRGLPEEARGGGQSRGREQQTGGREDPGEAWLHQGT